MVAVSVAWDGTRADAVGAGSSFASIGGGAGAGVEPDIWYQGGEDGSRKVGTSAGGFFVTFGGVDISGGTHKVILAKVAIGNWPALELASVPGLQIRAGSTTNAYYFYDLMGSDTYPEKGGFVFFAIDPTIAGYRSGTQGSPNLASFAALGVVGDFTATSKSENVIMSAVDVGTGYTVTGGGGADPSAEYSDINDYNATIANRHGFLTALEGKDGAYQQFGTVRLGTSGTAVDYRSSKSVVVYIADGLFAAGWARTIHDISNAGTVIEPTGKLTLISEGTEAGTTDTRAVYEAIDGAGSLVFPNLTLVNHAQAILAASGEWSSFDWQVSDLTQNGATLTDGTIRCTSAVNVAVCDDFTVNDTSGLVVRQEGAGHFVDYGTIAASSSINWTVRTVGFPVGATGSPASTTSNGNETIRVNVASGQTFTINVGSGASIPSVKNDGTGDVNIVAGQVTLTVTVEDQDTGSPIQNGTVHVVAASGGALPQGTVIINAANTNASGQVSDTRSYSGNQPVTGLAAEATSPGFYVPRSFSGTINATTGLDLTISLARDE